MLQVFTLIMQQKLNELERAKKTLLLIVANGVPAMSSTFPTDHNDCVCTEVIRHTRHTIKHTSEVAATTAAFGSALRPLCERARLSPPTNTMHRLSTVT